MRLPILIMVLFFSILKSNAQVSVIKMVGNNTDDYKLGMGAYLKVGFAVSEGDCATLEVGGYVFSLYDNSYRFGTVVVPAKVGYRYTVNRTGLGFYVEPQVGYNIFGSTTLNVNGYAKDFKFNGVVLAGGAGYMFSILDFNVHYETIMDKGGSNNYVRLGISFPLRIGKKTAME